MFLLSNLYLYFIAIVWIQHALLPCRINDFDLEEGESEKVKSCRVDRPITNYVHRYDYVISVGFCLCLRVLAAVDSLWCCTMTSLRRRAQANAPDVVCDAADRDCSYSEFRCGNRTQCVPLWTRCDGIRDCRDWSDESGCRMSTNVYNEFIIYNRLLCLQCFDTAGWASGRASGL